MGQTYKNTPYRLNRQILAYFSKKRFSQISDKIGYSSNENGQMDQKFGPE